MRRLALLGLLYLTLPLGAADLDNTDDAYLHAIQFVTRDEGWAVGDEGVVWHTIDGGHHWAQQISGVRSSLRAVQFLNASQGWVVGREDQPGGSVGVVLQTVDGGLTWRRLAANQLPGLNGVHFLDAQHAYAVGDANEHFSTGVFTTADGGRTWQPVRGKRGPSWLAADFGPDGGVLAGAWNRLAILRNGKLIDADVDAFAGRNVNAVRLIGARAVAVTEGGLVLLSDNAGQRWRNADLHLPASVRDDWDLHGLCCLGDHIWVVGRPGSAVLHSGDAGKTWQIIAAHQPLPLDAISFVDAQRGWAVGALGSILATEDGGRTWLVQHQGGRRSALLCLQARAGNTPLDTIAQLGGEAGYLAVAISMNRPDPESATLAKSSAGFQVHAALRQSGGAAGELLWHFPLAEHERQADADALLHHWDALHDSPAADELARQLVLALRIWRPDVVIMDSPEDGVGLPIERWIAQAMQQAFIKASDSAIYPDQIKVLGLTPWKPSKLYAPCADPRTARAILDTTEACPRLGATAHDFVTNAVALLESAAPAQRCYRLYVSNVPGAGRDLMAGLRVDPTARRNLGPVQAQPELVRAIHERRNLEAMISPSAARLVNAGGLIAQVVPAITRLPEDQATGVLFSMATMYARLGRESMAEELFRVLLDRYPTSPRTVDAYRWLIRHVSSGEVRRREELAEVLTVTNVEVQSTNKQQGLSGGGLQSIPVMAKGGGGLMGSRAVGILTNPSAARKYYQKCLDLGAKLEAYGPLFAGDPAMQFCMQSARRHLGDFDTPRLWYQRFITDHPDGPWHDAAAAELWLSARFGPSPKPVAYCRRTAVRPYLDGEFDDACWQNMKPLTLQNVAETSAKDYPTEAWLAYDRDFLYIAVRCRHPAGRTVPPVRVRSRDADLHAYDRVSLMLDLDRDYSSYFHLQIDQRGCVRDELCLGQEHDATWDPHWFVAVHSTSTSWQAEGAIPLAELTGEPVTVGHAWACNLVRVIPGRGVQAWSRPAGVTPRPEGMGLLMFIGQDARPRSATMAP